MKEKDFERFMEKFTYKATTIPITQNSISASDMRTVSDRVEWEHIRRQWYLNERLEKDKRLYYKSLIHLIKNAEGFSVKILEYVPMSVIKRLREDGFLVTTKTAKHPYDTNAQFVLSINWE